MVTGDKDFVQGSHRRVWVLYLNFCLEMGCAEYLFFLHSQALSEAIHQLQNFTLSVIAVVFY